MKVDVENPQAVLEDILTRINNGEYVKVVRCKDCRYCDAVPNNEDNIFRYKCLSIRYGGVELDWYCEHGARKEKTDEQEIH